MGGDSLALIFFPADTQQMLNVKKWPSVCFFIDEDITKGRWRKFEYWMLVGWDLSPCHLHCGGRNTGKSQAVPALTNTKYFRIHCTVYLHKNTQVQNCIISCRDTDPSFTLKLHCRTFESVTRTVHFARTQYIFNGEEHQGNSSQQCEKVWQRVALDT